MSKRKEFHKKRGNEIKDLTQKISKILNQAPSQSFNYRQICAKLQITDANGRNQIIKNLEELKAQKRIEETNPGKYKIATLSRYYTGTIDATSNGNGYFISDEFDHDIYIPARNLNRALHKDTVKIYLYNRKKNSREEGDVVEIIKRAKTEFVGVLQLSNNFGFVVPDDSKMYSDIFVP